MSPEPGFARINSSISLRRTPSLPDLKRDLCTERSAFVVRSGVGIRGVCRSEIEEEGWAQPRPGDIRGGGRPEGTAHGAKAIESRTGDKSWAK